MNVTAPITEFTSIKGKFMPKIKVLSAEKAFEAAHYGGPFDFNKETTSSSLLRTSETRRIVL